MDILVCKVEGGGPRPGSERDGGRGNGLQKEDMGGGVVYGGNVFVGCW